MLTWMGGFGGQAGRTDFFERVGTILCFHEIHGGFYVSNLRLE